MPNKPFTAFTTKFGRKVKRLVSEIGISASFQPAKGKPRPPIIKCQAIWDTGATRTVITKKIAKGLGLKPTSKKIAKGVHGQKEVNIYLVNVRLPNRVELAGMPVAEVDNFAGKIEALIGMDIIGKGDFAVTHADGKTMMSFRIPSIKHINYVDEVKRINQMKKQRAQRNKARRLEVQKKREKRKKQK